MVEGWELPELSPHSHCATAFLITVGDGFPVPQNLLILAACPVYKPCLRTAVGNGFDRSVLPTFAMFPDNNLCSRHIYIYSPVLLMPHGVPPGHRRGIAARNAGSYVRLLWFLQTGQVCKNQRTCRPSAETKDA